MPTPQTDDSAASANAREELRSALRDAARSVHAEIGIADGVGVTVLVGGSLEFEGCNSFTDAIDGLQYELMEGPCLSAQTSGEVVRSCRIGAGETRWRAFTPGAAALSLRSAVSAPLLTQGGVAGSLNFYGTQASSLRLLEPVTVTRMAEKVEGSTSSAALLALARSNAEWFARAVRDRTEVDMAVGVLVDKYRLSPTEARVLLKQLALEDDTTEAVAARTVISQDRRG